MKLSELTKEQLIKLAVIHPKWMCDNYPLYMSEHHPEYMVMNRPDWIAEFRNIVDDVTVPENILALLK